MAINPTFTEFTRVQIPALIHLARLGYDYLPKNYFDSDEKLDSETNIATEIFREKFCEFNPDVEDDEFANLFQNIKLELGEDNLGENFYNRLVSKPSGGGYRLIDWDNPQKNHFAFTYELPCKNSDEEFRPDITIFVNGLPLGFIEVKQPNAVRDGQTGISSELSRINDRFKNPKFRKFINITQLIIFSDNQEYSPGSQSQGVFYATTALRRTKFNTFKEQHFAEELAGQFDKNPLDESLEKEILKDTNHPELVASAEYATNKKIGTPTNRILTSLLTKSRFLTMLHYGIAYVREVNTDGSLNLQKHIMRYPQFFATKAIAKKLDEGVKRGVIWHTQGSGKTALSFYNVRYLTDYFSRKNVVPQFYFIVDRLDLADQAQKEFAKRGLSVKRISSKYDLAKQFSEDIAVVNIQKFKDDTDFTNRSGYISLNQQNIYFIDEAHRSYNPKGSYLASLYNADKDSVKIALTGTPLIAYKNHQDTDDGDDEILSDKENMRTTRAIFGDYIHKYYYNDSIADGYTLRLIREEILAEYKSRIASVENSLQQEIREGTLSKKDLYAHPKFVEPMLDFILKDFHDSRIRLGENQGLPPIGAMLVCDSSKQARELFRQFRKNPDDLKAALILHDEGDKKIREQEITDFKEGKIDILFVYSMLLTGFDAPRLKKLYLGRTIRAHNLLQTLTRVNRPYGTMKVGYVVDFANISKEFDATNQAYFDELNREYDIGSTGENSENVFGSLFVRPEEISRKIDDAQKVLLDYDLENLENFSRQISAVDNRSQLSDLRKSILTIQENYNIARLIGAFDIIKKVDISLISRILNELTNRLTTLSLISAENSEVDRQALLNTAVEDVVFSFTKINEEELQLAANDVIETAKNARVGLNENWDKSDPDWITLEEEFQRLMQKYQVNQGELTADQYAQASDKFRDLAKKIRELNSEDSQLEDVFGGDRKYARVFKKFGVRKPSENPELFHALKFAKNKLDQAVIDNHSIIENTGYFTDISQKISLNAFREKFAKADFATIAKFANLIREEYEDIKD